MIKNTIFILVLSIHLFIYFYFILFHFFLRGGGGGGVSSDLLFIMLWDECHVTSTFVPLKNWCRQATSRYLSQYWPTSTLTFGVTKPLSVEINTLMKTLAFTLSRWIPSHVKKITEFYHISTKAMADSVCIHKNQHDTFIQFAQFLVDVWSVWVSDHFLCKIYAPESKSDEFFCFVFLLVFFFFQKK